MSVKKEDKKLRIDLQENFGKAKKFGEEFKKFAMKGNVIDLAVGIVIGSAFGKIVTSLVTDLLTPLIVLVTGQANVKALAIVLRKGDGDKVPDLLFAYGNFLQTVFDFIIVAFFIFLMIKILAKLKKKEEEQAPAEPTPPPVQEVLLTEIRDELKKLTK